MKNSHFSLFVVIVLSSAAALTALAEPKAYDVVKYKGQVAGVTIAFDYGNGYPEASEVRIIDAKTGTTTRLRLDDSGEMRFVSDTKGGERKVILKMGIDAAPPPKLDGTFTANGKTMSFTLVRR